MMKRFSSLFLAAVLGSAATVASLKLVEDGEKTVKLEYMSGIPASAVGYTVNEDGEAVPLDFTAAAEKVMPAVVHIRSRSEGEHGGRNYPSNPFEQFFGPQYRQGPSLSSGSGVIISQDGYIVTNNHVIQGADEIEVSLTDNRTYTAELVGSDPDTDIALIRIEEDGLPYLAFVDSENAKVGEWVLAVGNPYNLNSTVTAGIISAKGRSINILGRTTEQGSTAIESFIQTDAAINPGNSGGALVDLQGGLLGINTAIASPTGSYSGYGFAVPSVIVSKIVEDLIQYGAVQRGWLGVSITSVNSQIAEEFGLDVREGAYVSAVMDESSAEQAGIRSGDVVVEIDGTPIHSNTGLTEYVGLHRPGDKLEITVNRDGEELTFPVVLKNRDGKIGVVRPVERGFAALGIELEEVDEKVLENLDIENGVRVKTLGDGKLASYTDIREGFIITKVNEVPVKSVEALNEILKNKNSGDMVILSGRYENSLREYNYAFRM